MLLCCLWGLAFSGFRRNSCFVTFLIFVNVQIEFTGRSCLPVEKSYYHSGPVEIPRLKSTDLASFSLPTLEVLINDLVTKSSAMAPRALSNAEEAELFI